MSNATLGSRHVDTEKMLIVLTGWRGMNAAGKCQHGNKQQRSFMLKHCSGRSCSLVNDIDDWAKWLRLIVAVTCFSIDRCRFGLSFIVTDVHARTIACDEHEEAVHLLQFLETQNDFDRIFDYLLSQCQLYAWWIHGYFW